jgi:MoxR-like ATPase
LQLLRVAKAQAALSGRHYVVADDLQQLAVVTLAHRLLPTEDAQFAGRSAEAILGDLLRRVPVPRSADDIPPGPRG